MSCAYCACPACVLFALCVCCHDVLLLQKRLKAATDTGAAGDATKAEKGKGRGKGKGNKQTNNQARSAQRLLT